MQYTYWCVEKGYARNTGANSPDDAWVRRARGWVRVMYYDVLLTMVVYMERRGAGLPATRRFVTSGVCLYLAGLVAGGPQEDRRRVSGAGDRQPPGAAVHDRIDRRRETRGPAPPADQVVQPEPAPQDDPEMVAALEEAGFVVGKNSDGVVSPS